MATYYDQTFTSGIYTYSIRVDMRTSVTDLGDGKIIPVNTITVTNWDGSVITNTNAGDGDIERLTDRYAQANEDGIAGVPNVEVDDALIAKGYTRH